MMELGPVGRRARGEEVTAVINLDGGATITLRYMDPDEKLRLSKKADEMVWVPGKDKVNGYDAQKQYDLLVVDATVKDWTDMLADGEDFPYSQENARLAILHSHKFKNTVFKYVAEFSHFVKAKKDAAQEALEKN